MASLQLETPPPNRTSRRSECRRSAKVSRRSGSNSSRPILKPKRRGHSLGGGGGHDESDTENIREDSTSSQQQQLVPAHKLAEVEKKCEDLTNKIKVIQKINQKRTKSFY